MAKLLLGSICEIAICRHVNVFDFIVINEQLANISELASNERLAARKIQVLEVTEFKRQLFKFFKREIIALVQLLPVEAVFAGQITDRIDENDHKRRRLPRRPIGGFHREFCVSRDA